MSETYTFKSGYEISTRDDYNPRLFDLTVEAFREDNPAPEPPIKVNKVRVKDGFKEIERKDWSDPDFIEAHGIWNQSITNESHMMLLRMAADPGSIDIDMLAKARLWAEENSVAMPVDNLRAYLQIVASKGEIADFFRWMNELPGPDSALVDSFMKMFQNPSALSGENGIDLGRPNPRRAVPRLAGSPAVDGG